MGRRLLGSHHAFSLSAPTDTQKQRPNARTAHDQVTRNAHIRRGGGGHFRPPPSTGAPRQGRGEPRDKPQTARSRERTHAPGLTHPRALG
ncbi:hypothetical protein SBD_1392 [Streptomyces bottropensis ATCC 25435]|uniref:Uncharacterized protein n=1 Tax=Streptomyces bottropensis ATCC 25435 TaxID=1054862 RepID=M3FW72_9ACTN|nr:hypothetical protein SBD_1392 [Streptomyces bottropensis ATCC 25435]